MVDASKVTVCNLTVDGPCYLITEAFGFCILQKLLSKYQSVTYFSFLAKLLNTFDFFTDSFFKLTRIFRFQFGQDLFHLTYLTVDLINL